MRHRTATTIDRVIVISVTIILRAISKNRHFASQKVRASPKERMAEMSDGFKLVDPPVKKPQTKRPGPKEMMVSAFNALSPKERAAKRKDGFTLVD
jgi:hypothetical protein